MERSITSPTQENQNKRESTKGAISQAEVHRIQREELGFLVFKLYVGTHQLPKRRKGEKKA